MTTYKVTGSLSYLGHAPGETFEAELEERAERRAVDRGAIRVVKRDGDKAKTEEKSDA